MESERSSAPEKASALRMVVLAGKVAGKPDPLADRFGQNHRSLIPISGRPLIAHVLRTAFDHPRITSLAICVEQEAFGAVWDVLTRLPGRGSVALVPAQEDLADSVRDAVQGWDGPVIVTTADHALLSNEAIDAVAGALTQADAAFALSPRNCVEAVHRAARRRFLSFRDGDYAACDIYGIAGPAGMRAVEVFAGPLGLDSSGMRIRRAAGLLGLILMRCRLLTVSNAVAFASRHLGLRLSAVTIEDGSQAIDVDDDHSYAVVRDVLDSRSPPAPAAEMHDGLAASEWRQAGAGRM